MQTDLIQQWTSSVKEITEFNLATMNTAVENMETFWGPKPLAKIGKTLFDAGMEQRKIQETELNRTIRRQVSAMDLKNAATSLDDFTAAATDTMTRGVESQVSIMNLVSENSRNYLNALSRSRNMLEIFTASVAMFSELQKDLPAKAMGPFMVMSDFQDAMESWAAKTVDNFAADTPETQKKD